MAKWFANTKIFSPAMFLGVSALVEIAAPFAGIATSAGRFLNLSLGRVVEDDMVWH